MTGTIFVQIAAYRDPDLPATLHNLLEQAAHPERLRFGICLQLAENDPKAWSASAFPDHSHQQVKLVAATDSRGACWARRQAQTLYDGEDYLLQIDSHMRAVKHWDDLLLRTWTDCNDSRAVLSVYPNGFKQPCQLQTNTLPVMAAKAFDNYGILKFQGISRYKMPDQQPPKPLKNAFVAGGFLFGPGSIVQDVPYDPDLYFYGEEISMSARLWTHGYNMFCPNRLLLFHLYKSASADGDTSATHWSDHQDWFQLNRRSLVRVHTLLGSLSTSQVQLNPVPDDIEGLDNFGLGRARRLEDYEEMTGISFKAQTISQDASAGRFPAS